MNKQDSLYGFCKVTTTPIRLEIRDASEMISQLLFVKSIHFAKKKMGDLAFS
jgi:hypothetical protein